MYDKCLKANNTLHSDQLAVIFWFLHWVSIQRIATILNKGLVTLGINPKYCHHIKQGFSYIRYFRLELLDKH